ncbi:class I SAM-dependent methyltransferase [Ilumatobacter nonamiensis]|uniref:class I SAM-dependent methyltransferase n=1 Tax=Ilumatobacter nonamiensis TaxID=467093 RepID=UPI000345AD55|nr:class I SAM-dependent methyltransferase [Ilumatobacter nonamiensis]
MTEPSTPGTGPDRIFADPRLAEIYDDLDGVRDDLDVYETVIAELDAARVLDIGCGTGVLACRLAQRGLDVIGLDPAAASLDVARSKPGAQSVSWLLGSARDAPRVGADAVTMTGNVAQVFVTDESWSAMLTAAKGALGIDGHLVFETRDPAFRGWEEWTREQSIAVTPTASGAVESWVELTSVELPLVSFRWTFHFLGTGTVIESDSTLRFRDLDEIESSLTRAGFTIRDVRDAPDRPSREFIVVASRTDRRSETGQER